MADEELPAGRRVTEGEIHPAGGARELDRRVRDTNEQLIDSIGPRSR
jgi:hypothetical protein